MTVSEENRSLARYLRSTLGGSPKIAKFWNEDETRNVDILTVDDVPVTNVSTYATLGLSDASTGLTLGDVPLGVELLLAVATAYHEGPNILTTCGLTATDPGMAAHPGALLPRVVELYRPGSLLKHVLLMSPFLWDLETQEFATKKVAWLQVIPISDTEWNFAAENGSDALEALFEEHEIDVFNLDRPPVI